MLGNALILAVSRTTTVRFFTTVWRKRLFDYELSKKARKKITFVFTHLTPVPNFLSDSPSQITKRGTFNAGIFERLMDTFPHPRRIPNRQRKFNESPHAKYTFS